MTASPTALALLRGINVGKNKRIPMAGLRDALAAAGFEGSTTYLQSGNVILHDLPPKLRPKKGAEPDDRALAAAVEKVIADSFGFDVRVVVRTAGQVAAVLAANPFAEVATDLSRYWVTFLDGEPDQAWIDKTDPAAYAPDQFVVLGNEVYLWLPAGSRDSKLGNLRWDREVGVAGTARNWKTVTKLNSLLAP